jgi:dethiobiotin synthetase
MRGIFVTGTDTGVGKTAVAAGIASLLKKRGINVGVMKPFATAGKRHSAKYRSEDTAALALAAGATEPDSDLNPSFFRMPAAPLVAAQLAGEKPAVMQEALFALKKLQITHDFVVVEGIGGLMVPLTEREFVADFAKLAGLPVIIVSHPRLGTINHTLLTVRACRDFGLDVAGIVINMMPKKPTAVEKKAPETIARLAGVPVVAVLPELKKAKHEEMARLIEKSPLAGLLFA